MASSDKEKTGDGRGRNTLVLLEGEEDVAIAVLAERVRTLERDQIKHERRTSRLEMAIISCLVACAIVVGRIVLEKTGILL